MRSFVSPKTCGYVACFSAPPAPLEDVIQHLHQGLIVRLHGTHYDCVFACPHAALPACQFQPQAVLYRRPVAQVDGHDVRRKVRLTRTEDASARVEKLQKVEILKRIDSLTEREREVMDQVVDGKANKVVAIDLNVSQRTVEIHRANVMDKMKARSLAQLVRLVMKARGEL
jgi:DNA-binding CsgD family transcriptional regulator